MSEELNSNAESWPVSWTASRDAQFREMAKSTASQRLQWLEQALQLALASGALSRLHTPEKLRRRGLA